MLRMAVALSCGVMVATTMVSIKVVKSMARECITGLMALSSQAHGSKMKCTAKENSCGLMVANTRGSLRWE